MAKTGKVVGLILVSLALPFAPVVGNSQTADPANQPVELFDFSQSLFPNGADKMRMEWEKEFIEFGKKTQLTPQNYIRHVYKWFESQREEPTLNGYRFSYLGYSGRYDYENFERTEEEIWGDKSMTREGYLFNHISRDAENVDRLWTIFDDLVIEMVSPCMKEGRLERLYVEIMISTWECISSKKNYGKKLDKLYIQLETYGIWDMEEYSKNIECEYVNAQLSSPRDPYLQDDKTWIYSFWVRRYHEGNAEVTYKILKAVLQ